tara:strand:- start:15709 stop:16359 length:651 start_codon:yes stop_codon:yes gene_type:complete
MSNNPFSTLSVLVDNDSWILPYAEQLVDELSLKYTCKLVRIAKDIPYGDVCFFLGCTQIVCKNELARNRHNLVVHESDLPQGKGFAPMSWQILQGKKDIPICLIEANEEADSGKIWLTDTIKLNGRELHDEWRKKQGEATLSIAKKFIDNFETLTPKSQKGEVSTYPRRSSKNSELCLNKTLAEQFDLLRVVSNDHYPAFFIKDGIKYTIEISRDQ